MISVSLERFIALWTMPEYPPALVSEEELSVVEARFGFRFPVDYRDAVLRFGLVSPTIALLDAIVDQELAMGDLSALLNPDEMIAATEGWREMGLPDDMVAFASDCSGNLFCFGTQTDGIVFYFDHDFGTMRSVAPSFANWISAFCDIAPA